MSSLPPTRASEESAAREPPSPPPGWSAATLDGASDDEASAPADLTDDALRIGDGARYRSVTLLGVGGMGEVVLVRDGRIGRHVARKTLRAKNLSPDARRGVTTTARTMLLAALASVTVLAATSYLGPFVMPPLCGVTVAVVCALYANPNERRAVTARLALTILGAFGVELLGLVEPAWRFHDGQITLFPRAVHLPERPTVLGLVYMSVSVVVAPAVLVGRMRDAAARLEQRQFLQAWQIRRLFPGAKT